MLATESLDLLDAHRVAWPHRHGHAAGVVRARLEWVISPAPGIPVGPRQGGISPQGGKESLAELSTIICRECDYYAYYAHGYSYTYPTLAVTLRDACLTSSE